MSRRQSQSGLSSASSLSSVVSIETIRSSTDEEEKTAAEEAGSTRKRASKRMKVHYGLEGVVTGTLNEGGKTVTHYDNREGQQRGLYWSPGNALGKPAVGKKIFYSYNNGNYISEKALTAKREPRKKKILAEDEVSDAGSVEYGEALLSMTAKRALYVRLGRVSSILGPPAKPVITIDHVNSSHFDSLSLVKGEKLCCGLQVWADLKKGMLYSKQAIQEIENAKRRAFKTRIAQSSAKNVRGGHGSCNSVEYYSVKVYKPT